MYVEQLYNYGSAVKKIMYTTNAIETVNSSFIKVTKKGTYSELVNGIKSTNDRRLF